MNNLENPDTHLTILIDIQKQLGTLGAETARQSEVLKRIDTQVQKTNSRVTTLRGSYWKCTRLPAANVGTFAA